MYFTLSLSLFYPHCLLLSLCHSNLAFSPIIRVQVMPVYSSTDTTIAWKDFFYISSGRSDFHAVNNLLIAVHVLPMHILTSHSVDKMLLLRYMNRSTNFRDLNFYEEMASF